MRLFSLGWEGNANVKWLRRLEEMDQPARSHEETSKYTELMADGTARQLTFDGNADLAETAETRLVAQQQGS
jgi:sulfane dehydrogenase subunit SoxC